MLGLSTALGLGLGIGGVKASFMGPLDGYAVGLAGAWSITRRLLVNYTGMLIRVRRSSDNTEMPIGFDEFGMLDVDALAAFVGSNSAYLTKVYDQAGGTNVTQSTAASQPRIVNAGTLDKIGGKSAAYFDGSRNLPLPTFTGSSMSVYVCGQHDSDPNPTSNRGCIIDHVGSAGGDVFWDDGNLYFGAGSTSRKNCGNPTPSLASPFLLTCVSASNNWVARINASALYATATNTVGFTSGYIGAGVGGTEFFKGHFREMVWYQAAHASGDWANLEPIMQP